VRQPGLCIQRTDFLPNQQNLPILPILPILRILPILLHPSRHSALKTGRQQLASFPLSLSLSRGHASKRPLPSKSPLCPVARSCSLCTCQC
jgi:hypothetical protein